MPPSSPKTSRSLYKYSFLLTALFSGLIGSYLLFGVKAAETLTNNSSTRFCIESSTTQPATGSVFDIHATLYFTDGTNIDHMTVVLSYDKTQVEFKGITCGKTLPCVKNTSWTGTFPDDRTHSDTVVVCFDATPGRYTLRPAFSAHFKALANLQLKPRQTFFAYLGSASGTCRSNPNGTGGYWTAGDGECGNSESASICASGTSFGDEKDSGKERGGERERSTGREGSGKTPSSGSGGGGSGSTANQQDDQPNLLPSQSSQGDKNEQPEVEPSPFFDGKQYEPGSDPDGELGIVAATGKTMVDNWPYVIGGVAAFGSLGAGVYWLKKRNSE